MNTRSNNTLLSMICLGLFCAAGPSFAEDRPLNPFLDDAAGPQRTVIDVALQEDGVIRGRVVEADGTPLDGSRVVLRQSDRIVAEVITDARGEFAAKGLASGVYEIQTPTGSGTYRFWRQGDAPPSASTTALVVSQQPMLRGQFGYGGPDLLALGLGAAGLTVGLLALDRADDAEGRAKWAEIKAMRHHHPASP